jgi:hypothetical protein
VPFTSTTLMAAASEVLADSGFRPVPFELSERWGTVNCRLYEDPYSLVAVAIYDTWQDLHHRWPDAQSVLVDLVASKVSKSEAKAWDVYLAILTPAFVDSGSNRELNAIRYDTTRVRKLIATGDDLRALDDVRRTLMPLLPIRAIELAPARDVFELLIEALEGKGIDPNDVRRLVDSFGKNEDLIPSLNRGDDEV